MYSKEKDLNQQLLNTADANEDDDTEVDAEGEDTGEEDEENTGPATI